jgi:hypothetical protein
MRAAPKTPAAAGTAVGKAPALEEEEEAAEAALDVLLAIELDAEAVALPALLVRAVADTWSALI